MPPNENFIGYIFSQEEQNKISFAVFYYVKKMRNSISLNKDNILDYGLSLNFDEKINIRNNYCTLLLL